MDQFSHDGGCTLHHLNIEVFRLTANDAGARSSALQTSQTDQATLDLRHGPGLATDGQQVGNFWTMGGKPLDPRHLPHCAIEGAFRACKAPFLSGEEKGSFVLIPMDC